VLDLSLVTEIAQRLCDKNGWGSATYIDHGNSAAVFRVDHPAHGASALKVYDPSFFVGDNAEIEVSRVRLQVDLADHDEDNIIRIFESDQVEGSATWYLLMEYCPWPTLASQIGYVPDEKVHSLIKCLVGSVLFLEEKGLIHRDIKPSNILVSNDFTSLKLLDLGVLRPTSNSEGNGTDLVNDRKFVATAQYSPPEYLVREEVKGNEGFKALNLYQVGAVLHDLINKRAIFQEELDTGNRYTLHRAIMQKPPILNNKNIPFALRHLCASALRKDPAKRIENLCLEDFLRNCEESEQVRRSVGALVQSASTTMTSPSLKRWMPKVRGWLGAAVRKEAEVLPRARFRLEERDGSLIWHLNFGENPATVFAKLEKCGDSLELLVVSDTEAPIESSICKISSDGLSVEEAEIVSALGEQIIYALSLAIEVK
tara:strand:- start:881 stop:2161 length:1281 start_codon:yes stop_codon:yes gene_type:complete